MYEDVQGEQPTIFVVQPLDREPLGERNAIDVKAVLEADAGVERGQSRLWEITPEGKLYEYSLNESPDQQLGSHVMKTEIAPETAQEITGQEIRSYEQTMEQQWRDLSGPQAGSYD